MFATLVVVAALSLGWSSAVRADDGATASAAEPTSSGSVTETTTASPSEPATESPSPSEPAAESPSPSEPVSESPSPSESPTPTPVPLTIGWATEQFTLDDGRTYYARVPTCAPADAAECVSHLARSRQVLVFLHGFGGREDADGAQLWLDHFAAMRKRGDTVFVYGISKDGSRAWNAGYCCTVDDVDDVSYLVRAVGDLATRASVNPARVGLFGMSNGGMMALRGACERPDVFDAGISWAGTYGGACDAPGVKVAQMHGALDKVLPVSGGPTTIGGRSVTIPPAAEMATRMAKGAVFPLLVYPGFGHYPNWSLQWLQVRWVSAQLTG